MTKEEVLQRANEYCNERSYDGATLTDEFRDKFAEFYAKRYESKSIDDEGVLDDIKFNLDTAKSAASRGLATQQQTFESKESDYKKQIAELNKKLSKQVPPPTQIELPKELQEQLEEFKRYKDEQKAKDKAKAVISLAKEGVRKDLHNSFEKFASTANISLEKSDKEQADALVKQFQEIFRDTLGEIKPLAPRQTIKKEDEYFENMPEIKVE